MEKLKGVKLSLYGSILMINWFNHQSSLLNQQTNHTNPMS